MGECLGLKASAIAHPIQGLIKYHGLSNERLRLPFHDSISVCTAPLQTKTTFEFWDEETSVIINGKPADSRTLKRVDAVVLRVKDIVGIEENYKMVSENSFPSNVGLGASSSGFAALALASSKAAGLDLSLKEISCIARLGAGSASRSVTGYFSRWRNALTDEGSYSYLLDCELEMGMVVALIPTFKETEELHREVLTSPFFHSRLAYLHGALAEMEFAIRNHDIEKIGELAERDTLYLHTVTMTGKHERILWRDETLKVISEIKKMRKEGLKVYYSIDTGASVYLNTYPENTIEVSERIEELGIETLECRVGGEAKSTKKHLF